MKSQLACLAALIAVGCARSDAPEDESLKPSASVPAMADEDGAAEPPPTAIVFSASVPGHESGADAANAGATTVKPWTAEQIDNLLATRIDGQMDHSFSQFSNVFLALSRIHIGPGIGLMTPSAEIAEIALQTPFPRSYEPTLREFLDSIALQTRSEWKYDPTGKYFRNETAGDRVVDDIAVFEFTPTERSKPFDIAPADGWKGYDRGSWLMLVPPSFPVGLDIYEMGEYSSDENPAPRDFAETIRKAVALQWAQWISPDTRVQDLQSRKVGAFDALYFEAMLPSEPGEREIRCRQWTFMDGNKCFFVISTIPTDLESELVQDVEQMVSSFRVEEHR